MSYKKRRAYLKKILKHYKKSSRQQKKIILDAFYAVCHYNRKCAVHLLHQRFKKIKHKRDRKVRYESARLLEPLKKIWLASD